MASTRSLGPGAAKATNKPAKASRAAARTRRREPGDARRSILDAATSEFSVHGLAGARVDRLAAAAGLNKAMIYHYFGDKEGLYLAVLERAYAGIREAEAQLDWTDAPPAEAVRRLVHFTWDYFVAHPEFLSLLNTENLQRARYVRRSEHVAHLQSSLVDGLRAVIARGEASGEFRRDVDPVQLYWSIAALGYFYLSNRHTLAVSFERELDSPEALAARRDHVTDVILGYLRP
ncbi:MAG: TetR/AcrR family transcriptional regulator [bacterium]|nr:TetR/AcrR family transcriptional regulator [bacterium]